jgi:hypothetical protein
MGTATFTDANNSSDTENRNLVPISNISFMPPQVVMTGDLRVMTSILVKLVPPPLPWWLNEWLFTERSDLTQMGTTAQQNVWNAITNITNNSLNGSGVFEAGTPCQLNSDCPAGNSCINSKCRITSCSNGFKVHTKPAATCNDNTTSCHAITWQDTVVAGDPAVCVDFVREHYEVDHFSTPQFFEHHRRWLDRLESMINVQYPGTLPFGYMPYWDSSFAIPTTFTTSQAPTNNCFTYTNSSEIPIASVESLTTPAPGCAWRVTPLGDPTWCNATTNPQLPYPNHNDYTTFCSDTNANWFDDGAGNGIHPWHNSVHVRVGGSSDGLGHCGSLVNPFQNGSFNSLDSPGSPIFYPWHAWIDHLFGLRCDCGNNCFTQ